METQTRAEGSASEVSLASLSAVDSLLLNALSELNLNIAQTAALCGISVRQLGYWTKQGYVTATGRGARRLYGLEALRKTLFIRHAMQNGSSLRQAIRAVASLPSAPSAPMNLNGLSVSRNGTAPGLAPAYEDALAADLRALFTANPLLRDSARGLAAKLGRAEEEVRAVAERLCAARALTKNIAQDETVYRAERDQS